MTLPRTVPPAGAALEALRFARDLISDPGRWTQRVSARDETGAATMATNSDACSWCALGAVSVATERAYGTGRLFDDVVHCLSTALPTPPSGGFEPVAAFNDRVDHARVLELFDAAIEGRRL